MESPPGLRLGLNKKTSNNPQRQGDLRKPTRRDYLTYIGGKIRAGPSGKKGSKWGGIETYGGKGLTCKGSSSTEGELPYSYDRQKKSKFLDSSGAYTLRKKGESRGSGSKGWRAYMKRKPS